MSETQTLTLRLRLPSGGTHTLQISSEASLVELFEAVAEAAGQEAEGLAMSCGFPPKGIEPEEDAKVGSAVQNMQTITVARSGASTGQAAGGSKKFRKAPAKKSTAGSSSGTPAGGGVATLSDVSDGGGGGSSSGKKRAAPVARGGGGGGGGGGKRRAAGALQLGSEEGIGESLVAAVSSKKGAKALHAEDPAMAFFKAAAGNALLHHYEEVLANDRFAAAQGGTYEMVESDEVRRADGSAAQCTVRFKVGRSWKEESFALLALPELRGVVEAVVSQLEEGGGGGGGGGGGAHHVAAGRASLVELRERGGHLPATVATWQLSK